jgi:pimeloyl-ACP methyl ester carboxylesterase
MSDPTRPPRLAIIWLLLSAATMSCSTPAPTAQQSPAKALKLPWIRKTPDAIGVIVFVHGVTGNARDTWTSGLSYWPQMLTEDPAFTGQDVYVYDYPSPPVGHALSVDEVAENLRLILDSDGVSRYRQLTFISHSLGGLVTRALLIKYQRDLAPKVRFLYFFATPTTGSPYARLAALVSQNSQFRDLYPLSSDGYLGPLQSNWLAAKLGLHSYCAYETRPLFGQMIVERQSATNLCTERLDPIDADHVDIVKPDSVTSAPYRAFKSAFEETARSVSSGGALRVAIEDPRQAVPVVDKNKIHDGQPVFCDAVRFNLVLSHDQAGGSPILVTRLGIESEPATQAVSEHLSCAVDVLSLTPHGIVEVRNYLFTVTSREIVGQYLRGLKPSEALRVDSDNIFDSTRGTEALTLSREGTDAHYVIKSIVQMNTAGLYRVRFHAAYDVDGASRGADSPWVYVLKAQ